MQLLVAHIAMSAVSVLHSFTQEMAINDLDQIPLFPQVDFQGQSWGH